MNKVLIIVGDATETVDTLYPYYRLTEDGFQPIVAAPETRRYQIVLHAVKAGAPPPSPSASSTSNPSAASTSTRPASSTETWSAAAPTTTTDSMWGHGSRC